MTTPAAAFLIVAGIATPQDTTFVRADGPPLWGDDIRVVEETRIGSLMGDEVYSFGMITGAAVDDDGSIYVTDMQVPAIRKYSPDGEWLRDIGREGQGPGEYIYLMGIEKLPGQPLAILDQRNARVTLYGNGEYLTSFPSRSGLFTFAEMFGRDVDRNTYVMATLPVGPRRAQRTANGSFYTEEESLKAWVRIDSEGTVVDTLPVPLEDAQGPSFILTGPGGPYRPYTVMTLKTLSPGGYVISARNDEYRICRPAEVGIFCFERSAQRLPVTAAEREQWEEYDHWFAESAREQGRSWDSEPIPRTKPLLRELKTDDDGRIWVSVYAESEYVPYSAEQRASREGRPMLEQKQAPVWEVFEADGTFLGRVELPHSTSILAVRGTTLIGLQRGEYDEQYVVSFRLTGPDIGN